MASFLTAAAAAIGSSSIGSALVRILVAYGISRLINKGAGQTAGTPDPGSRLQVSPDTTNPIPVLFGSAYYGGRITDAQLVDQNKTMWYCLTLSEVSGLSTRLSDNAAVKTNIDKVYLDNQLVTFKSDGITVDYITNEAEGTVNTSYRDLIQIYLYEKGSFAPTLPSNFLSGGLPISPAVLPGDARTLFPDWTDNHRMAGLTFALVKIAYNRDKGVTGLPDFQFQASNNLNKPGDAIYAYMRNSISGADLPASAIDTDSLIALNNYADDSVNYFDESDGTTKTLANRYQINGIINPSDNVLANLQKLAANAGCFLNYDIALGKWGVVINRDTSVSLHFDDSNIISGIDLTGTNLDNLYNSVKVEFPHREIRDRIDSITIDLPTEFRNANEPNNELSIKLDLLNEPLQARELAYLELYQNRMDQMVTFTTDYSKINAEAGDVISITNSVYSWTNKPFRIVRVREIESEEGSLAVEIVAQEYDATMYSAVGVPRRPRVPSNPIDIPDISIVGTPAAPTYVAHNNIAVPYISLTGVVPGGIVDRFEFWGSSTAGYADSTFTLLGTLSNSNGSPYSQGNSLTYSADKLPAGTYKFKVRAGNEKAYGSYSPLSTEFTWAPVQVTDQVTEKTTIDTPSLGDLLPILGMGAIAYFAYKAFAPEALAALSQTDLGKLLGIQDPAEIAAAQAALEQQAAAFRIINAGGISFSAGVDDTLTLLAGAGIEITGTDIGHEITISSKISNQTEVANSTGGFASTYYDPLEYSDGLSRYNKQTRLSVYGLPYKVNHSSVNKNIYFTHHMLVFGHPPVGGAIYNGTRSQIGGSLAISVKQDSFIPTKNGILKYLNGVDSGWNRVYTICTYDSTKSLEQQNWTTWKTWGQRSTVKSHIRKAYTETNPSVSSTYAILPPTIPTNSILCAFTNEDNNTLNWTGNEPTGSNNILYSNTLDEDSGFRINITGVDSNGAITSFTWTPPTTFSNITNFNTGARKLRTLRGTGRNAKFTIVGTTTSITSVTLNEGGEGYNAVGVSGTNTTQCYSDSFTVNQTWNPDTEGITIQPGELIMFGVFKQGFTPTSTNVFGNTIFARINGASTNFSYLESTTSTINKTINELTWQSPLSGSLIIDQPGLGDWGSTSITTSTTVCPF